MIGRKNAVTSGLAGSSSTATATATIAISATLQQTKNGSTSRRRTIASTGTSPAADTTSAATTSTTSISMRCGRSRVSRKYSVTPPSRSRLTRVPVRTLARSASMSSSQASIAPEG